MPLLPIKLPPGVYRNGTDFEGSDRWRDTNLVRWENNSVRPVGGWSTRSDAATTYAPRGMISWVDNSYESHIAIGTADKLYALNPGGNVYDITPAGFTAGNENATLNTGYGGIFYGTQAYGIGRTSGGEYIECTTWSLDTWGEYLIACSPDDGKLYQWELDVTVPTPAAAITNAPTDCLGLVSTEERFIFALGAGGNPRKIQWCDREDNTTWTPTATNEAGDFELQTQGEILFGTRIRGRTLIVTTTDAFTATYSGPPYVYGFERVGNSCGAVSRKGVASTDEFSIWMGKENFFMFDGSIARPIPCDVNDYVFKDINRNQISKAYAVHNGQFNEIWWFYPSGDSTENNRYVAYDYKENHWLIGTLSRTCGIDQGVFTNPIWVDADGILYDHERYLSAHGGAEPYAESGPISLGAGDQVMKVVDLIPDEGTQGEVDLTFKTRFYPNGEERTYGPYNSANPTSVRFTGRQIRMKVQATGNEDWRSGVMRLDVVAGGKR